MNRSCYLILGIFLAGLVLKASAQQSAAAAPAPPPLLGTLAAHPDWLAAKSHPSDVDTVDHLVSSLYDVISGAADKPRDWDRFRSLFLPDGRLGVIRPETPATKDAPARKGDAVFLTPDMYVQRDDPYFKTHGFFEASRTASRCSIISSMYGVPTRVDARNMTASHSREASIRSRLCLPKDASGLPAYSGTKSGPG
jgi:hypothetical protein